MPTLTLSDATFADLQSVAEPLVDTPESVIARLAREELERRGSASHRNSPKCPTIDTTLRLSPDTHENLKHTRLISASVDGQPIHRPKWNRFYEAVHVLGLRKLGSFDHLRRSTGANLRPGEYEDNGYKHLTEVGFSIQGVDSNLAWDHSLKLARVLNVPIHVRFEWRDKEGAAHPGETGVLEWTPS